MLEEIYGRIRHLGRKGEFEEHKRSDQRIQERISARYGRHGKTRMRRNNVQTRRIAGKIYGKEII